jgi:hypothetical protein
MMSMPMPTQYVCALSNTKEEPTTPAFAATKRLTISWSSASANSPKRWVAADRCRPRSAAQRTQRRDSFRSSIQSRSIAVIGQVIVI